MVAESVDLSALLRYVGEYLETDVSYLTLDSRLATALPGIDSLKLFELVLYLEDRLHVEFDDSVMENMDSLRDLLAYINSRLATAATTA